MDPEATVAKIVRCKRSRATFGRDFTSGTDVPVAS